MILFHRRANIYFVVVSAPGLLPGILEAIATLNAAVNNLTEITARTNGETAAALMGLTNQLMHVSQKIPSPIKSRTSSLCSNPMEVSNISTSSNGSGPMQQEEGSV